MNESMARQKHTKTAIAAAVTILVMGTAQQARAQQADTADAPQTVVVTGVRAALEQSLRQKRDADAVVEVVTAEDIGKMPDKNVADAIQRLPGVNTQSSAGGEGGFGENDRVSLRGTSPSLQQTLFNGHAISTGDWFLLNQFGRQQRETAAMSAVPAVSRCCLPNWSGPWSCRRARRPTWSKAASPAPSTSSRAVRSTSVSN
jgi:iron complex outermembrane receptor protein